MEVKQQYDYIIVGGGTAGSVVAARLAEKQGITVSLLEAGPTDAVCPEILSLNNWPNLFGTDLVYNYTIEKQARGNSLILFWLLLHILLEEAVLSRNREIHRAEQVVDPVCLSRWASWR